MNPVLILPLLLMATPAGANDGKDYLEACLAAAGGRTESARTTCFGQVSEVCLAETSGSTADLEMCARAEAEVWSELLDEAYETLRQTQPPERLEVVDRAQAVWLDWRDSRCAVYATFDRSIARPLAVVCLAETTARRVGDLWILEQGLSGEAP